ncbi:hypothetical protein [Spirulina major]|uniref:hypothetical protein n=1 Tax=Spirulina major TaxID=270636 RepID=UPI001FE40BAC|nr:hypothetical protein [Spirulina major]
MVKLPPSMPSESPHNRTSPVAEISPSTTTFLSAAAVMPPAAVRSRIVISKPRASDVPAVTEPDTTVDPDGNSCGKPTAPDTNVPTSCVPIN